jgi:transcriptional regulator
MYIPAHFARTDSQTLYDFIERYSFAMLVSQHGDEPFATHLPLLHRRAEGPHGALIGHMAKANPHWQLADRKAVLAVFAGPHAYVSPSWYEAENVVPTWNYVAVHVYGTLRVVEEGSELIEILRESLAAFEDPASAYTIDLDGDFATKVRRSIVGFRIDITRMEGKWKLNQNHPRERREKVIRALRQRGDSDSQAIADLMEGDLPTTN